MSHSEKAPTTYNYATGNARVGYQSELHGGVRVVFDTPPPRPDDYPEHVDYPGKIDDYVSINEQGGVQVSDHPSEEGEKRGPVLQSKEESAPRSPEGDALRDLAFILDKKAHERGEKPRSHAETLAMMSGWGGAALLIGLGEGVAMSGGPTLLTIETLTGLGTEVSMVRTQLISFAKEATDRKAERHQQVVDQNEAYASYGENISTTAAREAEYNRRRAAEIAAFRKALREKFQEHSNSNEKPTTGPSGEGYKVNYKEADVQRRPGLESYSRDEIVAALKRLDRLDNERRSHEEPEDYDDNPEDLKAAEGDPDERKRDKAARRKARAAQRRANRRARRQEAGGAPQEKGGTVWEKAKRGAKGLGRAALRAAKRAGKAGLQGAGAAAKAGFTAAKESWQAGA